EPAYSRKSVRTSSMSLGDLARVIESTRHSQRGGRRFRCGDGGVLGELATEDGHRLAAETHTVGFEPHAHHSTARRRLVGCEFPLAEPLAPVRPKAAMGGPRHRVFIDAGPRREE